MSDFGMRDVIDLLDETLWEQPEEGLYHYTASTFTLTAHFHLRRTDNAVAVGVEFKSVHDPSGEVYFGFATVDLETPLRQMRAALVMALRTVFSRQEIPGEVRRAIEQPILDETVPFAFDAYTSETRLAWRRQLRELVETYPEAIIYPGQESL